MIGATLFSGIGAPEHAAPEIDWRWSAEIDPFACAVLAERFPHIRNLGDVTHLDLNATEPVDLLVFGSPCQSFSVVGKRGGLDDPRGNLALVAFALIGQIRPRSARPRWLVFENVPGLLSANGGRDFGAVLGALEKCGYGFAYRILDAQYFGVPQRRRRLFIVGYLGDWRPAAAVLFERDSLRRDPPPRRKTREGVPPTLESRAKSGGASWQPDFLAGGGLAIPLLEIGTRNSRSADDAACGLGIGEPGEPMYALQRGKEHGVAVVPLRAHDSGTAHGAGIATDARAPAIAFESRFGQQDWESGYAVGMPPRRLTPRECERLQGLPDDWTLVTYRGKPAADGPRYRAVGNSMAVPVVRWIIRRIRELSD
jgi:DNA (cytosine-5)-methyltransferase 1